MKRATAVGIVLMLLLALMISCRKLDVPMSDEYNQPTDIIEPVPTETTNPSQSQTPSHSEDVPSQSLPVQQILSPEDVQRTLKLRYSIWWSHRPEYDIIVDNILFYCGNTSTTYTLTTGYTGEMDTGFMWVNSFTGDITERLPDGTSPVISRALAEGFPDRWNYSTYSGLHDYEDCRSYLVLFLSQLLGLTAYGNIKHDMDEHIAYIEEWAWASYRYRFRVQLDNDQNSEELIFYVDERNLQVFDEQETLLNPDGWLWPLPERILTQEEAMDRLCAEGGAARWYEYRPDKDIIIDDILFYGYATFTQPEQNNGESHTGYIWVNSTTGKFETYNNPLFEWLNNPLFETTGVMSNETFKTEPNILQAAYKAYYELIESLIDDYGVGYNRGNLEFSWAPELWWTITYFGVVNAELIDFDNDGLPELLVIYNNGETWWNDIWAVYGYTGNIEQYCKMYYGFEGGGGSDVGIALSSKSMKYLVYTDYYYVNDDEREYCYFTVKDGSWDKVLTRSVSITDESKQWDYHGDFQWQWFVNGDLVSENEYETAPETELGIIGIRSIPFYTRYYEDLETKNERAYLFINTMLAELENRISLLETLIS